MPPFNALALGSSNIYKQMLQLECSSTAKNISSNWYFLYPILNRNNFRGSEIHSTKFSWLPKHKILQQTKRILRLWLVKGILNSLGKVRISRNFQDCFNVHQDHYSWLVFVSEMLIFLSVKIDKFVTCQSCLQIKFFFL